MDAVANLHIMTLKGFCASAAKTTAPCKPAFGVCPMVINRILPLSGSGLWCNSRSGNKVASPTPNYAAVQHHRLPVPRAVAVTEKEGAAEAPPIEAWYMDSSDADQVLPHRQTPNRPVPLAALAQLGLGYHRLNADIWETDPELQKIRTERGYTYGDVITCSPQSLENYDDQLAAFFKEHIHQGAEVRYVLEGSGYFDVRDADDNWVRIHTHKGDLIIVPEGIYHRFTLDSDHYIKALRLFNGVPVWTPFFRPQEEHPARKAYLDEFVAKAKPSKREPGFETAKAQVSK